MMKLARNSLEAYEAFVDDDGNDIQWFYFEELALLQKSEGLRAGNRLTVRHTNFKKQKMKVKLAVQLLSSSVSTALNVCEKIGLTQFNGCVGTSKFAKMMDRIFDALNSRPGGKGFKAPLAQWNRNMWKALFSEAKVYLLGQKRKSDNRQLIKTKRSTFVKGLLVCMESLTRIMDEVVLPGATSLNYLCTYKLSQDHLELFFSSLRQRFGNNNNPNVVQLEYALKRMLAVQIEPNGKGNCGNLENVASVSPLTCLPGVQRVEIVNEEIPLLPTFRDLSCFVNNVVVYISGFVGRKISSSLQCSPCLSSLLRTDIESTKIRSDFILVSEKNNGGLFIPSDDLISVCQITEKCIRSLQALGVRKLNGSETVKEALKKALKEPVFVQLNSGVDKEHQVLGNHRFKLIEKVNSDNSRIRLFHISKEKTLELNSECIRNYLTKTVTFQGQ